VYVNKGVYSSARWTRLKHTDARAASGDDKHSSVSGQCVHEAFVVIIFSKQLVWGSSWICFKLSSFLGINIIDELDIRSVKHF